MRRRRRQAPVSHTSVRKSSADYSGGARARESAAPADMARWNREDRPQILRSAVAASESLRRTGSLLEILLDEMYTDESVEGLLGRRPVDIPRQSPLP